MLTSNKLICSNCFTEHESEFQIPDNDRRTFQGKCKNCHKTIKFKRNENGLMERDSITFFINDQPYSIGNEYPLTMTLNEYIRDVLDLTGTKVSCREGGCGSCVINAEVYDFFTKNTRNVSINTCLFPLYACDGIRFTTVEGVGNKSKGFNEIQKRLADNNGSQCGWCSTGMVMNMYSLLLNNPKPTKEDIENAFDGNICRCTGYRPILDAMKSFSTNEHPIHDLEDLNKIKCLKNGACNSSSSACEHRDNGRCLGHNQLTSNAASKKPVHIISNKQISLPISQPVQLRTNGLLASEWYMPTKMDDVYALLVKYATLDKYKLICGNTSVGVYKPDLSVNNDVAYINVKNVDELNLVSQSNGKLVFGAALTLNQLINHFDSASQMTGFKYLSVLSKHFSRIANVAVRNVGSWSGNLMMKYFHNDFPSDVFVCFEAVNAKITLVGPDKFTPSTDVTPMEFLQLPNLNGKCIYSVTLSALDDSYASNMKTYKIMPRSQNAHAYVNAGIRMDLKLNQANQVIVSSLPSIIYGGISGKFIHATNTEQFLVGKPLSDQSVLSSALAMLNQEIVPDETDPVLASAAYRKSLAISLFYKYVLSVLGDSYVSPAYASGRTNLEELRGVSHGEQFYPTDPSMYPVTKGMTKINAYLQASGEAEYVFDIAPLPNELHGAFVQAQQANCRIDQIDDSQASKLDGVVKIIYAKDIPGQNTFAPMPMQPELLFCDDQVDYAGQAVGLVIAKTYEIARRASKMVKITYKDIKKPILSIADAIQAGSFYPKPSDDFKFGDADTAIKNSPNIINGEVNLESQFHFYLENQSTICKPTEDGYELWSATQWLDLVQNAAALALGVKNSSCIDVKTKQLGGAYGGRITRANIPAVAAAVACKVVNRPVRVILDLNTDLELKGKRYPWSAKYTIGFENNGKLNGIHIDLYNDAGNNPNDCAIMAGPQFLDNAYDCKNWQIGFNIAKTNLPANTACRSPGTFPSICIIETIMEHVAKHLNASPLEIRWTNLYKKGDVTPAGQPLPYFDVDLIIDQLMTTSEYSQRLQDINEFNQSNRWKKRGLSLTPIKWGVVWNGGYYNALISIYQSDGSIALTHGGIEVGQGITTKLAQITAYELGVPMELISVKPATNMTNPNSQCTGGSITTECVAQAVIACCKILNDRLDPVRKQMPSGYTWPQLIAKAFSLGIDLCARDWVYPTTKNPFAYDVHGAACSESLIDVLTGETQLVRTDILYDCGQPINGLIDIGQAEGAFMMGVGFWLMEKIKYDPNTGKCLTNGTWEYKPPTSKDIPIDLRVNFLNNNPNPLGVLGSKAIGEPPLCLSPSVAFAVKNAIESARNDSGNVNFFQLDSPVTVDVVQQLCLNNYTQFKLKD